MNKIKITQATISDKIYIPETSFATHDNLSDFKAAYTYLVAENEIYEVYSYDVLTRYYSVPSNSYHKLDIEEVIDKRNFFDSTNKYEFTDRYTLRKDQQIVVNSFFKKENRVRSGLIQAECSWGKTFAGCALIVTANKKTLILVHTSLLFNQWVEELEKLIPNQKIGKIGSGYDDIQNITVAIYKSIPNRIDKIKDAFGLVLVDECLDYESSILTDTGDRLRIGYIVNNKLTPNILSYNCNTNMFEYKQVYNWFKNPQHEMLKIYTNKSNRGLKCTNNHSIYLYENNEIIKKKAENIIIGNYLVSSKTEKTCLVVKKTYLNILLGLILGDGCIDKLNDNAIRIKITHGEKQKEYLNYKIKIINKLFKAKSVISKSGYKPDNKIYGNTSLNIVDNYNLYESIYLNSSNKNNITYELIKYCDEITWALLYQDDGSISNNQITFSVCEFNIDSCNLLIGSLKDIFNIEDAYVFTCNRGFNYIRLKTKSTKIFLNSINKYIHPTMKYKTINYNKDDFKNINIENAFEEFSLKKVQKIEKVIATNGYRYNISVKDNHNYVANEILVGNCHSAPADMFSSVLNSINAKAKIGLSATPRRKDGKHATLPDFFTPFKIIGKDPIIKEKPKIHVIETNIPFPLLDPKKEWAKQTNKLASNEEYMTKMAALLNKLVNTENRRILVIAQRVGWLEVLQTKIHNSKVLLGKTSEEDRKEILNYLGPKYSAILTTTIFDEGVSCHRLDTLALAFPGNNLIKLEQRIGRIIRDHPDKNLPVVYDFWFKGAIVNKQQQIRLDWYRKNGYEVTKILF